MLEDLAIVCAIGVVVYLMMEFLLNYSDKDNDRDYTD